MLLNGRAPLPGQVMTFPDLAKTFRSVATEGKDGFYKGRIADSIVQLIDSKNGVMTLEDLKEHHTEFVEPIGYTYKGEVTLWEVGGLLLLTQDRLILRVSALRTDKESPPW